MKRKPEKKPVSCKTQNYPKTIKTTHKQPKPPKTPTNLPQICQPTHQPVTDPSNQT